MSEIVNHVRLITCRTGTLEDHLSYDGWANQGIEDARARGEISKNMTERCQKLLKEVIGQMQTIRRDQEQLHSMGIQWKEELVSAKLELEGTKKQAEEDSMRRANHDQAMRNSLQGLESVGPRTDDLLSKLEQRINTLEEARQCQARRVMT